MALLIFPWRRAEAADDTRDGASRPHASDCASETKRRMELNITCVEIRYFLEVASGIIFDQSASILKFVRTLIRR